MKYIEAKVIIKAKDKALAEELVVSIFDDLGLSGVLVEDSHDVEALPSDSRAEIDLKPVHHAVIGYIPVDSGGKKRCGALESALAGLKIFQNIDTAVSYAEIDEEDWAESWKVYFKPEKIGDHVVVKPTWHNYEPGPNETIITIDPGMAFGTGTHPTTALCIRMLEKKVRQGQSILDIGTGSGILIITAAKLGAGSGIGIDNDFGSAAVASANLAENCLDSSRFFVAAGNLIDPITGRFDLVTANILTDVIMELIVLLPRVIGPGGLFICSGIIEASVEKVAKRLHNNGFNRVHSLQQDEWICIAARFGNP